MYINNTTDFIRSQYNLSGYSLRGIHLGLNPLLHSTRSTTLSLPLSLYIISGIRYLLVEFGEHTDPLKIIEIHHAMLAFDTKGMG